MVRAGVIAVQTAADRAGARVRCPESVGSCQGSVLEGVIVGQTDGAHQVQRSAMAGRPGHPRVEPAAARMA